METDNKEKLTLKELVGYLPYQLKFIYNNDSYKRYNAWELVAIEKRQNSTNDFFAKATRHDYKNQINNTISLIKPILRPLSDLTKSITHNGETFVPIVEICKLSETVNNVLRLGVKSYIISFDFENSMSEKLRFCYHNLTKNFGLLNLENDDYESILYQHDMFEKLYEWHFDIHGLMERGLAIDINTLPND